MSNLRKLSKRDLQQAVALTGHPLAPGSASFYTRYEIQLPDDTTLKPKAVTPLIHSLFYQQQRVILSIRADHHAIRWLVTPLGTALELEEVEAFIQPHFPEAQLSIFEAAAPRLPNYRQWGVYQLNQPEWFTPLLTVDHIKQEPPLDILLRTMSTLRQGEVAQLELYIVDGKVCTDQELLSLLFMSARDAGYTYEPRITFHWMNALVELGRSFFANYRLAHELVPRFEPQDMKRYMHKLTQPLLSVRMCLLFDTPDRNRNRQFMAMNGALQSWSTGESRFHPRLVNTHQMNGNPLQSYDKWLLDHPMVQLAIFVDDKKYPFLRECTELRMTPGELATIWHLPNKDTAIPKVHWIKDEPVSLMETANGILLGQVTTDTVKHDIRLQYIDAQYPILINGAMGMGKTTLADHIIQQLMGDGYGMLIFDPQGPLADRSLMTASQNNRLGDVTYLNVGDEEFPAPLSMLRVFAGASKTETLETLLFIFRAMYEDHWDDSMVRLQNTIQALLNLALHDPESTLFDLLDLIDNPIYLQNMLHIARQQGLSMMGKRFWRRYDQMTKGQKEHYAGSAASRIGALFTNQHVANMLCHPFGIDFRTTIRDHKIIIVDASSPAVEDSRSIIGTLLLAHVYLGSRALGANFDHKGKEKPPRFYLVLDEADMVLNRGLFKNLNSKIRQFGTGQIYISQSMSNYDSQTVEVMRDNQGTVISLGSRNPNKAAIDAKLFAPNVTVDDLLNLSKGTAAITTRYNGEVVPGFLMNTFDRPVRSGIDLETLKAVARKNLNMLKADGSTQMGLLSRAEVEAWLDKREERDILRIDPIDDDDTPSSTHPIPEYD